MKAAAVILVVALAAGCDTASKENTPGAVDTVAPVAEPMVTRTAVMADTEAGATLVVILEDNTIGMPVEGIAPGPVVFTVRNAGQQLHAFALEGPGVTVRTQDNLANGQEASLEATLAAGSYRAWCPLHETVAGEAVQFQVAAP